MPCMKCNNNKYKYGLEGRCQFDTLSACEAAERAIYARESKDFQDSEPPSYNYIEPRRRKNLE